MSSDSPTDVVDAINTLRWELRERLTEPVVTAITEALELHSEEQTLARILAALLAGGHIGPVGREVDVAQARKLVDLYAAVVKVIP